MEPFCANPLCFLHKHMCQRSEEFAVLPEAPPKTPLIGRSMWMKMDGNAFALCDICRSAIAMVSEKPKR